VTALERRYRWLLRAYPGWYLVDRGEEMLDTLLEAAADTGSSPGAAVRQWPSPREARTLILGGLRVGSGRDQRLTTAANLRLTVLLAVIILLCDNVGQLVGDPTSWAEVCLAVLTVVAVALTWTGRRLLTGVVALAAAGLWAFWSSDWQYWLTGPVIALVAIAALAPGKPRMPPGWRWPVLALYLDLLVRTLLFSELAGVVTSAVVLVLLALTIPWSAVDARPIMALVTLAAARAWVHFLGVSLSALGGGSWSWWDLLPPVLIALVLSMAVFWRLRRQSVL